MTKILFFSMPGCGHCESSEKALAKEISEGKIIKKNASDAKGKFRGFPAFTCNGKSHMGGVPSYKTLLEKLGIDDDKISSKQKAAITMYIEDWCGFCTKAKLILEKEISSGLINVKQASEAENDGVNTSGVPHFKSSNGNETAGCPENAAKLLESLDMTTENYNECNAFLESGGNEYNCNYGNNDCDENSQTCCDRLKKCGLVAHMEQDDDSEHFFNNCKNICKNGPPPDITPDNTHKTDCEIHSPDYCGDDGKFKKCEDDECCERTSIYGCASGCLYNSSSGMCFFDGGDDGGKCDKFPGCMNKGSLRLDNGGECVCGTGGTKFDKLSTCCASTSTSSGDLCDQYQCTRGGGSSDDNGGGSDDNGGGSDDNNGGSSSDSGANYGDGVGEIHSIQKLSDGEIHSIQKLSDGDVPPQKSFLEKYMLLIFLLILILIGVFAVLMLNRNHRGE